MNKNIIIGILVVVVVGVTGYYLLANKQVPAEPVMAITSFNECAAAGYFIMESYPRQCAVPGGASFVEDIGNELEKTDLIRLDSPRPGDIISSPLIIKGQARGTWYFEASFPIKLTDANGNNVPLEPPYIMTDQEWMTTEFVPFEATITFTAPATATGKLILQKDNPSGLPESDDQLIVPVRFTP